jgi:hypothetical protein
VEEPAGGVLVAASRDENVNDLAVLVDRPVHPPVDGDVIDLDTTLDQQFFNVATRQVGTHTAPYGAAAP